MSEPNLPNPRRWRILPVVLVASFMALFDAYVANLAAPTIQARLHASVAEVSLAVAAYLFAFAAGQITSGRLGDLYGHRRLFVIGVVAFAVTSAACGLAATPVELIVARLAEGAAGAIMVPQVLALITALFPDQRERSKAVAWYGVTIGAGSVCGQVFGGALLQANVLGLTWRPLFLINVPIGLLTAVAAALVLPAHRRPEGGPRLDLIGTLGVVVAIGLLVGPLTLGAQEHWPASLDLALGLSVPAMATVIAHQRRLATRGGDPLLAVDLLGPRSLRAGLAFIASFMAFLGAFNLGISEYLQDGLGLSALRTGLAFAPLAAIFALTSLLTARLAHNCGRAVIVTGIVVTGVAVAALLVLAILARPHPPVVALVALFAVVGLGNGLAIPSLYSMALADVPPERAGAGSGMLNTSQQFANAIGVALLGAIFAAPATTSAYRQDLSRLLVVDLVFLAVAFAAAQFFSPPSAASPRPTNNTQRRSNRRATASSPAHGTRGAPDRGSQQSALSNTREQRTSRQPSVWS